MSLAYSCVSPATLVVAKSLVGVHVRILLLTLDTNKSASATHDHCATLLQRSPNTLATYEEENGNTTSEEVEH
jgi:hypothetical protein